MPALQRSHTSIESWEKAKMPEQVLPSQFFHVARAETPGHRLLLAVLENACDAVELYRRHPSNAKAVQQFLDVKTWLEECGEQDVMAFEIICQHLGFDAEVWRRELLAVRSPRPIGKRSCR